MNLAAFAKDLHVAFRRLRKSPVYAGIAVVTLGLALGANTAMFSIVDSLLLRPLPYRDPERLAVVFGTAEKGSQHLPQSPANYLDLKRQASTLEDIAAAEAWGPTLGGEERPEKLSGLRVTANLLDVLGVQPIAGRPFRPSDEAQGAEPVLLLGDGLARRLGGVEAVLGKPLRLDGVDRIVIGVMPERFVFPTFWITDAQVYTPLQWDAATRANRRLSTLRLFGRLRDGRSFDAADAEVRQIAARLAAEFPVANAGLSSRVAPLHLASGGDIRPTVLALFGAVAALLLVACANLAGLLIARASERTQEMAVRRALGASGTRIRSSIAAESVLLGVFGTLAGIGLAAWSLQILSALIPAAAINGIYGAGMVRMNLTALTFSALLGIAAALLFGIAPALATSGSPANALRERGGTEDRRMGWLRSGLVIAQCAVAFVLVVFSGLMARSFANLSDANAGFDASGVLTFVAPVTGTSQAQPGRKAAFYGELVARLRALPGVESASAVNHVPLLGDEWGTSFLVEGQPTPDPGSVPRAVYRVMMPGYLETIGASLREGRDFREADHATSLPVVVVNETLARRRWPGASPIGKRIRLGSVDSTEAWLEVVGVVNDIQQQNWNTAVQEELMVPFAQDRSFRESARPPFAMTLAVRGQGDADALAALLRQTVAEIAPDVPVARLQPLSDGLEQAFWRPRLAAGVGIALALLAALLSALGIYGVFTQWVNRQQRAIGIRMALGQSPRSVLRKLMLRGLTVAIVGAALGMPLAISAGRLAESLLVDVQAADLGNLASAMALLAATAAVASWLPARRAAGIDPVDALRAE